MGSRAAWTCCWPRITVLLNITLIQNLTVFNHFPLPCWSFNLLRCTNAADWFAGTANCFLCNTPFKLLKFTLLILMFWAWMWSRKRFDPQPMNTRAWLGSEAYCSQEESRNAYYFSNGLGLPICRIGKFIRHYRIIIIN